MMKITQHRFSKRTFYGVFFWLGCMGTYTSHAACDSPGSEVLKKYIFFESSTHPIKFEEIYPTFEAMLHTLSQCPDDGIDELYKKHSNLSEAQLKHFIKKYYQSALEADHNINASERKEGVYSKLLLRMMRRHYDNENYFINKFVKLAEETFREEANIPEKHMLRIFFYNILNAENPLLETGLLKLLSLSENVYKERFDLLNRLESKEVFVLNSQLTKKKKNIEYFRQQNEMNEAGEVEETSLQTVLEALMVDVVHAAHWYPGSKAAFFKKVDNMFQQRASGKSQAQDPLNPIKPIKPDPLKPLAPVNPSDPAKPDPLKPESLPPLDSKDSLEFFDPEHIRDNSNWKKNTRLFQKIYDALMDPKKKERSSSGERREGRSRYGRDGPPGRSGDGGGRNGALDFKGTGLLGYAVESAFKGQAEQSEKEHKPMGPTLTFLKSRGLHANAHKVKNIKKPRASKESDKGANE